MHAVFSNDTVWENNCILQLFPWVFKIESKNALNHGTSLFLIRIRCTWSSNESNIFLNPTYNRIIRQVYPNFCSKYASLCSN